MKDCPSFKLTKTSRVLERKWKKKSAAIKLNKGTYMLWSFLYIQTVFKKQRMCSKRGRWEPVPRSCTSWDFTEILKLARLLCIMICRHLWWLFSVDGKCYRVVLWEQPWGFQKPIFGNFKLSFLFFSLCCLKLNILIACSVPLVLCRLLFRNHFSLLNKQLNREYPFSNIKYPEKFYIK